jgi:outer membrane protein assembly factor BamE
MLLKCSECQLKAALRYHAACFVKVKRSMFNKFILIFISVLLVGLSGCSSFSPYKMEIRQGNYVTQDMRKKVKVGMSRQQVSSVLGSPLVTDVFHANRWDYIYRFEEKTKLVEQQRLTVYFQGDFVSRIDDSQSAESKPADNKSADVAPVAPAGK